MAGNRNLKITVIEDNPHMAEMIKDFLEEKFTGSEVTTFNTGEKALGGITSEPDVVVLDYQLDSQDPKALNGIQILMKLRKMYHSPVIFLSGQDRIDIAANTMKYGASDYVIKNKDSFPRLEIGINNILKSQKLRKSLDTQKILIIAMAVLNVIFIGIIIKLKFF